MVPSSVLFYDYSLFSFSVLVRSTQICRRGRTIILETLEIHQRRRQMQSKTSPSTASSCGNNPQLSLYLKEQPTIASKTFGLGFWTECVNTESAPLQRDSWKNDEWYIKSYWLYFCIRKYFLTFRSERRDLWLDRWNETFTGLSDQRNCVEIQKFPK